MTFFKQWRLFQCTRSCAHLFVGIITLATSWTTAAIAGPNEDLFVAAERGDAATVQALLDKGADVNAKDEYGRTVLMEAAVAGYREALMLREKVLITPLSPSIPTCAPSRRRVIKALLAKGADVNAKDKYGDTVLIYVADQDCPEVVKILLDKGAGVNVKANDGKTALDIAKSKNRTEIVKLLKQAGAKP